MAIDPSIYNRVDTQFGLKLADLFNPAAIAQRQAAVEEQNMGNQLRQMQVMQGVEQMRRAPELARREDMQYRAQQAESMRKQQLMEQLKTAPPEQQKQLFAQLFPDEAAKAAFKPPVARDFNQPFLPDGSPNVAYQQYKMAEQRAGKSGTGGGLSYSDSQGGFIEKPSAQYPNGRIIPLQGAGTSTAPNRKPMTADQEAKYRQKFGEAYGATMTALKSSDDVVATAKALKESAGLEGMSGLSGYFPNMPGGKAAGAQQQFETLQGKITKMAKEAAAASGAIGPMAVQEWKILRDQVVAIDPTKLDAKQMQDVLDYLVIQSEQAARITEESYTSTFSPDFEQYPQFANPRAAVPKQPNQPPTQGGQPARTQSGATASGW